MYHHSYSRSQETGAIRLLQPLSRAKEERMRVFVGDSSGGSFSLFSLAAFAADLKVKVVDPQGCGCGGGAGFAVSRGDRMAAVVATTDTRPRGWSGRFAEPSHIRRRSRLHSEGFRRQDWRQCRSWRRVRIKGSSRRSTVNCCGWRLAFGNCGGDRDANACCRRSCGRGR